MIIIGQKILLNLFLAILLENFDEQSLNQEIKEEMKKETAVPLSEKFNKCWKFMFGKRCRCVRKAVKKSMYDDAEKESSESSSSNSQSVDVSQMDFDEPSMSAKGMLR